MTTNLIYNNDSTSAFAYNAIKEMGQPINMICTDPPYGMAFVSNRAVTPEGKAKNRAIEGDESIEVAIDRFMRAIRPTVPLMADECEIYVFTAWHCLEAWLPAVKQIDPCIELKMMLVWNKGYPGQGDLTANWGCGHEIILYLKKGRRPINGRRIGILNFDGDIEAEIEMTMERLSYLETIRDAGISSISTTGIIPVDKLPAGANIHPTEKPVDLLVPLIALSTEPGDLVVDFFSGSGSTSKAAQQEGRNSIAFELDETHYQNSLARMEQTGLFG